MVAHPLVAVLEADFRELGQLARKGDGGFGGFFASENTELREAAERAVLKELLKPLLLGCDTKAAKTICQSLSTMQKMLANNAVSEEGAEAVLGMLSRVEKSGDESVQLKSLQTALTLLQSPVHPRIEERLGALLAVCFRLLSHKNHKDAVLQTAAATVRQAVALVFSFVDVPAELARLAAAGGGTAEAPPPPPGILTASQKLMEDLCAIAAGTPAAWLKAPPLPRAFVLELLDFVLTNSPDVFRLLPPFQAALSQRIAAVVQSQLQDYLDAGAASGSFAEKNFPTFRALLRLMRTLLRSFYPLLGPRSGALVQCLMKGLSRKYALFQRIAVMQLFKQLLGDPFLTYYLFQSYDLQQGTKLDAVQAMIARAGEVVEATLSAANKDPEDEPPVEVVSSLYTARTAGKDWTMDSEYESADRQTQSGYLAMLAIDAQLGFMGSMEKLADVVVERGGAVPKAAQRGPGSVTEVDAAVVRAMVDKTWRSMLTGESQLLAQASGEEVALALLKGYQVFTQACGLLELRQPRDAFLGNLCEFALASASEAIAEAEAGGARAAGVAAGGVASPRPGEEAGLVLAPKNVQAMRTLFNIAHRLSNVLGPAWALVLETMNTLDRILNSPSTTTREVSDQAGGAGVSSDLTILAAAASQMFECSRDMSRGAVVSLLSGLRDVSVRNIPAASVVQPKLFALNRMVEVLLFNIHRIFDLWAIFLSHVLEVINDPRGPVRAAAIDALGRAISGALASLGAAPQPAGGGDGATPSPDSSTGGVEHMLLVALEALYNDDKERDVRAGVLRVLLSVLQRHGERLSDGWTPVFRLLAAVPGAGEAEATDLAFQSVQLTCSDYVPSMPFARLKRALELAVIYGRQQVELNVSLTTISLLWNAADLFSRAPTSGGAGGGGVTAAAAADSDSDAEMEAAVPLQAGALAADEEEEEDTYGPSGRSAQLSCTFTPAQTEELLQLLFLALQSLSQDPRPEVRNSGARTLFAVVVNQGPRLSRGLWEQCLWDMLFPLLRHAFLMSANASKEEAEAMLLGQSRGKAVRMMVHHSRNTEQKQWDETVVIALGGMGRLLRAHLPAIVGLERSATGWEEMMVVVESSMAGGRKEVALAAAGVLGAVLHTHGAITHIVTPDMWKRALRAIDVGAEAATSPTCMVPLLARLELLGLIGQAYAGVRSRFDADDTRHVFAWVDKFCRNPWSDDDATNTAQVAMGMPPVQKAVLALLPALAPTHAPKLYPEYIAMVVGLLQPELLIDQWRMEQEAAEHAAFLLSQQHLTIPAQQAPGTAAASLGADAAPLQQAKPPPGAVPQFKFALTSAFMEKVLEQLVPIYRDAPTDVCAVTFATVVAALGKCMEVRHVVYQESLWRAAAATFNAVVATGIPPVASVTEAADMSDAWAAVAEAFETFLLGPATASSSSSSVAAEQVAAPAASAAEAKGAGGVQPSSRESVGSEVHAAASSSHATPGGSRSASQAHEAAAPPGAGGGGRENGAGPGPPSGTSASQAQADAELEAAVLDTLTDCVLTQCGPAPAEVKLRFIRTVDRGIVRPRHLAIPLPTAASSFCHLCVRKMYALCSRAGGAQDAAEVCLLEVAQLALPVFVARCEAMLLAYAAEEPRHSGASSAAGHGGARPRLDELMCMLEALASMVLAPAVIDAAIPAASALGETLRVLRGRPEMAARGRERAHLLLLYAPLCGLVTCRELRVREMVKDVLQLAGAELGLWRG
eukprot:scaffold6.g2554.t1